MSPEQKQFKKSVEQLINDGVYPSAKAIREQQSKDSFFWFPNSANLNGRECKWRREVAFALGFRLKGKNI